MPHIEELDLDKKVENFGENIESFAQMGKQYTSIDLELMCIGSENDFSPVKELDLNFLQAMSPPP